MPSSAIVLCLLLPSFWSSKLAALLPDLVTPAVTDQRDVVRKRRDSNSEDGYSNLVSTSNATDLQVNRLEITPDKRYLAAAGNPHIRLFDVNSTSPQPVMSYDSHTNNVMAMGFQCDGKWMYSGSEDGTVKIWDLRAPGCQREYKSRAAVNTVVLHPNQLLLIQQRGYGQCLLVKILECITATVCCALHDGAEATSA